jgi:hypothetical protein
VRQHDFREGPDWWSVDDYAEILSNMAKLRGNFIGLHTYTYHGITNWAGPADAVLPNGSTTSSPLACRWATAGGGTHFVGKQTKPFPTSKYFWGAAALFDTDCFSGNADVVTAAACPAATDPEEANAAFERAGRFQAKVFGTARSLGVTTATGIELPVAGRGVWNHTAADIYAGTLLRLKNLGTPLDFFWLWTSEQWEWAQYNETNPAVVEALAEFAALAQANRKLGSPFKLATAGWTLGPLALDSWSIKDGGISPAEGGNSSTVPLAGDRTFWDSHLSEDFTAFSSIDGHVGAFPPNPSFAQLNRSRREGWAIPWMEDDPGITSVQLWAGRVLQHANKSAELGVSGLFGIHWRTRALSPQISALLQAGWNDTAHTTDVASFYTSWCEAEFGGSVAGGRGGDSGATRSELVRAACEPFRMLDAQQCSGNCKGLAEPYPLGDPRVANSGCGDPGISNVFATADCLRPVAWGSTIGIVANDTQFPNNKGYNPGSTGQGSPVPDPAQCGAEPLYRWVDGFSSLDLRAHGAAALERWRYWEAQFRAMRAQARVNCAWARKESAFAQLRSLQQQLEEEEEEEEEAAAAAAAAADGDRARHSDSSIRTHAREVALPAWMQLQLELEEMFTALLESVTNVGEMGVVADLQDSKVPAILNGTDRALLEQAMGGVAIAGAGGTYRGRARLFAPTLRPYVARGEPLTIRAILLSNTTASATVTLQWRELGETPQQGAEAPWTAVPMKALRVHGGAGGVWVGQIKAVPATMTMIEWMLVGGGGGAGLLFPVTAPARGQSVIIRSDT